MIINAFDLHAGSIVDKVDGNPNIRGTITQVEQPDASNSRITIGNRHITLHNLTKVQVWVSANEVCFDFPVFH